jgi:hypothetical protein
VRRRGPEPVLLAPGMGAAAQKEVVEEREREEERVRRRAPKPCG